MKVLVTGANGFVGSWIVSELLKRDHEVLSGVRHLNQSTKFVNQIMLDILNYRDLKLAFETFKPDVIFHLAAQSNVKKAWDNPGKTMEVNVIGTLNILQAAKEAVPNAKIINIGSSEEYGSTAKVVQLLKEDESCVPQNPYALSKFTAGQLALQIAKKDNLHVIHLRPFNHFGPGQRTGFVVSDFASQIAKFEETGDSRIYVGDLSAKRDFTDVRDVVAAYIDIIESSVPSGIYNISSGKATSINEILNILIKHSLKKIEVCIDPLRFRQAEVPEFCGDSNKVKEFIPWSPIRSIEDSLIQTLNWWRMNQKR